MTFSPQNQACPHLATPQEQTRDPSYLACEAGPGDPCRWATRHDGLVPPPFHAERLEAAVPDAPDESAPCPDSFQAWVLETGLV